MVPVGTAWNARRVVQHLFKDDITKRLKEGGHTSSDSDWLHAYHEEVNKVWSSLDEEEGGLEKYVEMAKTWNDVGPPEEVKRK